MHQFALPLEKGDDVSSGLPVLGFTVNDVFIHNPLLSECGRFEVDPLQTYGISVADANALNELNALVERAAEDAINTGCLAIQKALEIASGDVAGVHFSGNEARYGVARAMRDYIASEAWVLRD